MGGVWLGSHFWRRVLLVSAPNWDRLYLLLVCYLYLFLWQEMSCATATPLGMHHRLEARHSLQKDMIWYDMMMLPAQADVPTCWASLWTLLFWWRALWSSYCHFIHLHFLPSSTSVEKPGWAAPVTDKKQLKQAVHSPQCWPSRVSVVTYGSPSIHNPEGDSK